MLLCFCTPCIGDLEVAGWESGAIFRAAGLFLPRLLYITVAVFSHHVAFYYISAIVYSHEVHLVKGQQKTHHPSENHLSMRAFQTFCRLPCHSLHIRASVYWDTPRLALMEDFLTLALHQLSFNEPAHTCPPCHTMLRRVIMSHR